MTVKELKELLKDMDDNKQIKVSAGNRTVRDFDVYFNKEEVWDSSGIYLREVYVMYGDF